MKFFSKLQQLGLTKRVTRFGDAIAAAIHQLLGKHFKSFEHRSFSKRPHPLVGVMPKNFWHTRLLVFRQRVYILGPRTNH